MARYCTSLTAMLPLLRSGKTEHVGLPGDEAARRLARGEDGVERGVGLHFAVDLDVHDAGSLAGAGGALLDLLPRQRRAAAMRWAAGELRAALGRKTRASPRAPGRRAAGNRARPRAGRWWRVARRVGSGITAPSAKNSTPSSPTARSGSSHDHAAEDRAHLRQRLEHLEQRAQQPAGIFARAAHQAVGQAVLDHHRAEIIRVDHDLARIVDAEALVAVELVRGVRRRWAVPRNWPGR